MPFVGGLPTVTRNARVTDNPSESDTVNATFAKPDCPATGVTEIVRLEPLPPSAILLTGNRLALSEVTEYCTAFGPSCVSVTVYAIGPLAPLTARFWFAIALTVSGKGVKTLLN